MKFIRDVIGILTKRQDLICADDKYYRSLGQGYVNEIVNTHAFQIAPVLHNFRYQEYRQNSFGVWRKHGKVFGMEDEIK